MQVVVGQIEYTSNLPPRIHKIIQNHKLRCKDVTKEYNRSAMEVSAKQQLTMIRSMCRLYNKTTSCAATSREKPTVPEGGPLNFVW